MATLTPGAEYPPTRGDVSPQDAPLVTDVDAAVSGDGTGEQRSVTHVWRLVEAWRAGLEFPPSQSAIGERLGVDRSAVSQWKYGQSSPTPPRLRALAELLRVDYVVVLEAAMRDAGYLAVGESLRVSGT